LVITASICVDQGGKQGEGHYLWRAVDQGEDVLDILVQNRRDSRGPASDESGCGYQKIRTY